MKPDIILASATAYGEGGPYSDRIGFDGTGQVMSGAVYRQGLPDQPIRTVVPYADFGTALTLAIGVMMALYHRQATGRGPARGGRAAAHRADDVERLPHRARPARQSTSPAWATGARRWRPCDLYEVDDGWVLVQVAGQPMFKRWCRLVGREDLFDDPRFADDDLRWEHGDVLNDLMQEWCAGRTKAEALALLEAAKLPGGAAALAPGGARRPARRRPWATCSGCRSPARARPVPIIETPFRMSATPGTIRRRAPLLGEHTDEILAEIGYDADADRRPPAHGIV